MIEYSEFDINTGNIYSDLSLLEDLMPRSFFHEFEDKLKDLLWYKPFDNLKLPFNEDYTNSKIKENEFHTQSKKDEKHRPYSWFFLKPSKKIDGFELVDFLQPYLVNIIEDESSFDYFFAVKFRLIDTMKIRQFLFYQFGTNFKSEFKSFEIFLHDLMLKYENLLNDGKRNIIIEKFLNELKTGNMEILKETESENEDIALAVKVLAVHYLLKAISPDIKRKDAAKARFIKMLTGGSADNIYKMVQSPLSSRSGKLRIEEMEMVRTHFKDLGLDACIKLLGLDY